jgi:hypothetical protein
MAFAFLRNYLPAIRYIFLLSKKDATPIGAKRTIAYYIFVSLIKIIIFKVWKIDIIMPP